MARKHRRTGQAGGHQQEPPVEPLDGDAHAGLKIVAMQEVVVIFGAAEAIARDQLLAEDRRADRRPADLPHPGIQRAEMAEMVALRGLGDAGLQRDRAFAALDVVEEQRRAFDIGGRAKRSTKSCQPASPSKAA